MNDNIIKELQELKKLIQEQNLQQKEILTLVEAAKYLGMSTSTLYKFSHQGILPKTCPNGKRIYFMRSSLDEFMRKGRKASNKEIEQEAINYISKKK